MRHAFLFCRFILIALILVACFTASAFFDHSVAAQQDATDPCWSDIKERHIKNRESRNIFPESYRTVRLRKQALRQALAAAPQEFAAQTERNDVLISMPLPDGSFGSFRIEESPILQPSLAAR